MDDFSTNEIESLKKKSPVLLRFFILFLAVLQNAVAIILGIKIINMGIIPNLFIALGVLVVIGIDLFIVYAVITNKLAVSIIAGLISLIISAVLIFITIAVFRYDKLMNTLTVVNDKETVSISVYVRMDDPITDISELSGETMAYSGNDNTLPVALTEIDKLSLGIEYKKKESNIVAFNSLLEGENRAMVMNSSFLEIIGEHEGYENIVDKTRELYTFTIEVDKISTFNDSDTTTVIDYKYISGEDTFVVYITGVDSWESATERNRSDVNLIAVVNTKTGHVQLINTPRDFYVYMPTLKEMDKLTHCGLYGVECSKTALEELYRVKIDYYVKINFTCFEKIIDSIGGIDVYSEYDFTVDPIKHYTVGYNHCTGKESLAFARERYALEMGDFQRGNNQMEVIKAFVKKVSSPAVLVNYETILKDIEGNIVTDMPSDMLNNLIKNQISTGKSWNIESYTVMGQENHLITYTIPDELNYVLIPDAEDVEEATNKMGNVLTGK